MNNEFESPERSVSLASFDKTFLAISTPVTLFFIASVTSVKSKSSLPIPGPPLDCGRCPRYDNKVNYNLKIITQKIQLNIITMELPKRCHIITYIILLSVEY